MPFIKTIKHCLRYPLMWVMLLWALTLPGHELAVYSFLVKGNASEVIPSLRSSAGTQEESSLKQQTVHVFLDAQSTTPIVLSPQQAVKYMLQLFDFAVLSDDVPGYTFCAGGAKLLARLFPITIQPNAP